MSETVFIFGAGASVGAGAPVMKNFLDVAREMYLRGLIEGESVRSFAEVFRGIAALNDVYAKATIDTDNLEAVFGAFEMAQLFDRLPRHSYTPDALANLTVAFKDVIVRTLEDSILLPVSGGQGTWTVEPPNGYHALIQLLRQPGDLVRRHTFMTFNYDLALDYTFRWHDLRIDYGLVETRAANLPLVLKLHGSTNWTKCDNCSCGVGVMHLQDVIASPRAASVPIDIQNNVGRIKVADLLKTFAHCNDTSKSTGDPLLVPPTWSKAEHHFGLATVWRHAARELETARNIIVIGYSLPETDAFFRYLYALGTVSDTRLERFWVIDPDPTGEVSIRFQKLLGGAALARFEFFPYTFDQVTADSALTRADPRVRRVRDFFLRGAI
jgi:hypothetical protein